MLVCHDKKWNIVNDGSEVRKIDMFRYIINIY
jgi:hypothetical protein